LVINIYIYIHTHTHRQGHTAAQECAYV